MARKPVKAKTKNAGVRKRTNWILYIAVIGIIFFIIVTIIGQNIRISNARAELAELENRISLENIKIDELKNVAAYAENGNFDSFSDYIERKAREEMGYVNSGEVVFINIAGH